MSDDQWRRKRRDDDDFGPPLFGDPSDTTDLSEPTERTPKTSLSFDDASGPLPHWSAPASGELPRVVKADADDDLDVWKSFGGQSPVWSDDESPDPSAGYEDVAPAVRAGRMAGGPTEPDAFFEEPDPSGSLANPARREPGRITIGTDPTDEGIGRPGPKPRQRPRDVTGGTARPGTGRPSGSVRVTPGKPGGGLSGRDMPVAVAVGAGIAAVFIGAIKAGPKVALIVVVVVIGLAAIEFFEKVTEKGYQPASVVGIIACAASPLAAYFYGELAVPLVVMLAFVSGCVSFIGAPNLNSSPMPNMAITTLGITWIGLGGAYGGLILGSETRHIFPVHGGTDTLLIMAIGVVINDIGALFVGSAAGKTPLRGWISPNKSVEGFIGGTVLTIIAMVVVGVSAKSATWSNPNLIFLGVIISIAAPLGDLTESMFKRNLDIKDFGSIVKGHGGVLDRFDGFLFTLPAVYYLTLVLTPWIPAIRDFTKK